MVQFNYSNFFPGNHNVILDSSIRQHIITKVWSKSGIYCITNTLTGDCYVGQAKNIFNRIKGHFYALRNNKHIYATNSIDIMQKAFNKYGEDCFKVNILEYCEASERDKREIYWISAKNCNRVVSGFGYNLTDGGSCPPSDGRGTKGKKLVHKGDLQKYVTCEQLNNYLNDGWILGASDKTKLAASELQKNMRAKERQLGIIRHFSEDTINKMKAAHLRDDYHHRLPGEYTHSLETRLKIGIGNKGKIMSAEAKQKISAALKGRTMSRDSIEKVAKAKYKPVVQLTLDGKFVARFDSAKQASEQTGIPRKIISLYCNNKKKKIKNFNWRFEKDYE